MFILAFVLTAVVTCLCQFQAKRRLKDGANKVCLFYVYVYIN